jgi:hypothetical protein
MDRCSLQRAAVSARTGCGAAAVVLGCAAGGGDDAERPEPWPLAADGDPLLTTRALATDGMGLPGLHLCAAPLAFSQGAPRHSYAEWLAGGQCADFVIRPAPRDRRAAAASGTANGPTAQPHDARAEGGGRQGVCLADNARPRSIASAAVPTAPWRLPPRPLRRPGGSGPVPEVDAVRRRSPPCRPPEFRSDAAGALDPGQRQQGDGVARRLRRDWQAPSVNRPARTRVR